MTNEYGIVMEYAIHIMLGILGSTYCVEILNLKLKQRYVLDESQIHTQTISWL